MRSPFSRQRPLPLVLAALQSIAARLVVVLLSGPLSARQCQRGASHRQHISFWCEGRRVSGPEALSFDSRTVRQPSEPEAPPASDMLREGRD